MLQSKRTTNDIKSVLGDRLLFISILLPLSQHYGFGSGSDKRGINVHEKNTSLKNRVDTESR